MLGGGAAAAGYYLERAAGCRADYYLDRAESAGRWVRAGLDATIRAPKGVPVLYGLAGPEVAAEVRAGHEAAVEVALDYLARHAGHGLRGHQGDGRRAARIGTDGLVAAAFTHRSSRAN